MLKVTQILITIFLAIIAYFSFLSYKEIKKVSDNTFANEYWFRIIDNDLKDVENNTAYQNISSSNSAPTELLNYIDDVNYSVNEIDDKLESIQKRLDDFGKYYLQANLSKLK